MNKGDSEQLASRLENLGYKSNSTADECAIVVVNSCVVRQSAENRVISKLNSLATLKTKQPDTLIALTGCIVDSEVDILKHRFPFIDLFLRPGELSPLMNIAKDRAPLLFDDKQPRSVSPTAFVTIIEGCNNFCSYCIVPYRRGREKSRPLSEIRSQTEGLVQQGVKEVTLLGQNVDSYGHDLPDRPDLADLLYDLNTVSGLNRIRFLTSHPKDMTQKLIDAVAALEKVCEQISLPVQAGDNRTLRTMGRGYTAEQYRDLILSIRNTITTVSIATDLIVGFPGETDEQFQRSYDLLSDLKFDVVHIAAYSPRPGTRAAIEFDDDVPSSIKKLRLRRIEELQEAISSEINARLLGQTIEILVECRNKGRWQGRSRTGKLVFFDSEADYLGELVDVEIQKTSPWSLQGLVKRTHR